MSVNLDLIKDDSGEGLQCCRQNTYLIMSIKVLASIDTLLFTLLSQGRIVKKMAVLRHVVRMVPLTMAHDMEDWRHLEEWCSMRILPDPL